MSVRMPRGRRRASCILIVPSDCTHRRTPLHISPLVQSSIIISQCINYSPSPSRILMHHHHFDIAHRRYPLHILFISTRPRPWSIGHPLRMSTEGIIIRNIAECSVQLWHSSARFWGEGMQAPAG